MQAYYVGIMWDNIHQNLSQFVHVLKTREKTRVEKIMLRTCRYHDFYIIMCLAIDSYGIQNLVQLSDSIKKLFKNVFLLKTSQLLNSIKERNWMIW